MTSWQSLACPDRRLYFWHIDTYLSASALVEFSARTQESKLGRSIWTALTAPAPTSLSTPGPPPDSGCQTCSLIRWWLRPEDWSMMITSKVQWNVMVNKILHVWLLTDDWPDQAKEMRIPTYYIRPASLRVYNDSTIRYSSRWNGHGQDYLL